MRCVRQLCLLVASLAFLAGCPSKEVQVPESCVGVGCPCTTNTDCSESFTCSPVAICVPVTTPDDSEGEDENAQDPDINETSDLSDAEGSSEQDAVSELAEQLAGSCFSLCVVRVECGSSYAELFGNDCTLLCEAFRNLYDQVIAAAPVPSECAAALEAAEACANRLEGCAAVIANEDLNSPESPCFDVNQATQTACGIDNDGFDADGSGAEGSGSEGSGG